MEIYNAVENMEYSDDEVSVFVSPVFSLSFLGKHEIDSGVAFRTWITLMHLEPLQDKDFAR